MTVRISFVKATTFYFMDFAYLPLFYLMNFIKVSETSSVTFYTEEFNYRTNKLLQPNNQTTLRV